VVVSLCVKSRLFSGKNTARQILRARILASVLSSPQKKPIDFIGMFGWNKIDQVILLAFG